MWPEVWKIVNPHFCALLTSQTSQSLQAAKTIKFMASLWKTKEAVASCICLTMLLWKWIKGQHLWTELTMSFLLILSPRPDSTVWLHEVKVMPRKLLLKAICGPSVQGLARLHWQMIRKCRYYISWGQGITVSRDFQWCILVEKNAQQYICVNRERTSTSDLKVLRTM